MTRGERRKYHYIYKTVCLVTNRYYIGMHSTDNLEDGYVGSGERLWHSINKYGIENHKCEIQEFLLTRELLRLREREMVNEEKLKDQNCMNLIMGGGAFPLTKEQYRLRNAKCGKKGGKVAGKINILKLHTYEPHKKAIETRRRNSKILGMTGKTHSIETRKKMSGEGNSQFGSCWIFNEHNSIKIKKDQLQSYLDSGWFKGRKIKFSNH